MAAMAWDPQDYIALVSVLASPLAALGGAWLNSYLTRRQRAMEQAETLRKDMAASLGPMLGIVADLAPSLIVNADLREYDTPEAAIAGLYDRWSRAREPLLVMHYSHPSEKVRKLAFDLQATVEMSLRTTADLVEGKHADASAAYQRASAVAYELGQEVHRPPT